MRVQVLKLILGGVMVTMMLVGGGCGSESGGKVCTGSALMAALKDQTGCEPPDHDGDEDGFLESEDCNDDDPAINPDAVEVPNNDVDENCDPADDVSTTELLALVQQDLLGVYLFSDSVSGNVAVPVYTETSTGYYEPVGSISGGNVSSNKKLLILDKNNRYLFCISESSSSSISVPTGTGYTTSSYSSSHNRTCTYGDYTITLSAVFEEESVGSPADQKVILTFKPERLATLDDSSCYQAGDSNFRQDSDVFFMSALYVYGSGDGNPTYSIEYPLSYDEMGKVAFTSNWGKAEDSSESDFLMGIFYREYVLMGVDYDVSAGVIEVFNECRAERVVFDEKRLTVQSGIYHSQDGTGYYVVSLVGEKGSLWDFTFNALSGYGSLTIIPKMFLDEPYLYLYGDSYSIAPYTDEICYSTINETIPIWDDSANFSSYQHAFFYSYVVPETGEYEIQIRHATQKCDDLDYLKYDRDAFYIDFYSSQ